MTPQERLQQDLDSLLENRGLAFEALHALRNQRVHETRVDDALRLDSVIQEKEKLLNVLEEKIRALEDKIKTPEYKLPTEPTNKANVKGNWRREFLLAVLASLVAAGIYAYFEEIYPYIEGITSELPFAGDTEPEVVQGSNADESVPISLDTPQHFSFFRDDFLDGSGQGPEMAGLPGGTFDIGSPSSEAGRETDEKQLEVTVKPFAIGIHEVTFAEYDRFAEATTGCEKPHDEGWGRADRPVINVSWHDAVAYAEWLSQQTGHQYRLPTEAEWEYAARGGTETAYWWGDAIGENNANCSGCGDQWPNTAPVGSFASNSFGLFDTAGNVWEWTCSAHRPDYDGSELVCLSKNHAAHRVIRGGSWFDLPRDLRAACRLRYRPDERDFGLGFRLARTYPSDL